MKQLFSSRPIYCGDKAMKQQFYVDVQLYLYVYVYAIYVYVMTFTW